MKKLSIITINYNNAIGLKKTIESVVNQTSRDFEYLVIDGGSTDGSVDIIKEYEDKISYWISEPDNGIYSAMNKGIIAAKGKYCQFLNSGDFLASKNVTELMLKSVPECSVLYGNMIKLLKNGKLHIEKTLTKPTLFTFYRGTLNHSSAYIKRSLFDKYGLYDEELRIVSDWKWYLIVIGLNNEVALYRDVDMTIFNLDGISNTQSSIVKQERRQVLEEFIPPSVLKDYDTNWHNILMSKRINNYKITQWLFWITERLLFKLEKWNIIRPNA